MVTVMTTTFVHSLCIAFILLHTNCCPPTKASLFTCSKTILQSEPQRNIVPWMNLTSTDLRTVIQRTSSGDLERVFRKINVIREVDTPSHAAVRKYIMDYLTSRGWFVELDSFHQPTVIGPRTFHNVIARLSSVTADHNLVLACHYDSKRMPNFFGSVDSAMPCAILLEVADILTSSITRQKNPVLGIQLIFFDGEEAFLHWSDTDSLYGSRHLAEKWSKPGPDGRTELSKIKLLVLLDLIGAPNLSIPDYGYTNEPYFELFTRLEHTMNQNYLLRNPHSSSHRYFRGSARGQIQDDHIPFFRRGVPILHLIPASFPPVWHTDQDNENNISWDVSMDMLNLMVAFVQSSLHLTL
ncbi:Glutaminyl-peptide cyclotransferase [Fasciola hepatica]|uniref:glutaminyl-peptide cyclotransferase n=1 Tax=Fasciola hepatica TaxID=6192 RepID=A0A4E0S1A4_FASHE|nr:Glutaminyl-peptide cyclotransferase [Fasciola hepatica]